MPDPLEELKQMLQESMSASKARHDAAESRAAADSHAQATAIAGLRAELTEKHTALAQGLTNLNSRFDLVEKKANEAHSRAEILQKSYDEIAIASQDQWRGVTAGQEMIAQMLRDQQEEKRRSDEARIAARHQESLAAERLATEKERKAAEAAAATRQKEKEEYDRKLEQWKLDAEERERIRTHDENRRKTWTTAMQTILLALITSVGGYYAVRAGHQDTDAKIEQQGKQLTSLAKRLEAAPPTVLEEPDAQAPIPAATAHAHDEPPPSTVTPPHGTMRR